MLIGLGFVGSTVQGPGLWDSWGWKGVVITDIVKSCSLLVLRISVTVTMLYFD